MSDCNWPNCGCQNVHGAPWCKATARPSITWTVVQPAAAIDALAIMSPPKPNEPAEIMREVNAKAKFEAFERKLNERGGYLTWADTENHRKEFGGCRITSCGVTYDYGTHPLAALAMRERAAEDCDGYCYECATAIRALPTTFTDAELLAAAMQLPEGRALVDAADDLLNAITAENKFGDRSLTITGPTANLKLLMGAEDDALAAIAPFTKGAS